MATIKSVSARQILDSKGIPTIESLVTLSDETWARSSAPSGLSQSAYEAHELRDGDGGKYNGMGVLKAVQNVTDIIAPKLLGIDSTEQQKIDRLMIDLDGTANKEKIGGNAIISVSQAVAKAAAKSAKIPLFEYIGQFTGKKEKKMPVPLFSLIEGGKHGKGQLNFQEFLLIPASTKTYTESLEIGSLVYASLQKILTERNRSILSADEGGFSPDLATNQEALSTLKDSVEGAGLSFSLDAFLGLDCASDSFFSNKNYTIFDKHTPLSTTDMIGFYQTLTSDFSLIYLEDPLESADPEEWKKITPAISSKALIVGDDLISASPYRLQAAVSAKAIGGVVIKPNQIGTISEAIALAEIAKYTNLKIIVSSRSGETNDTFIADFAVGIGADYVKFGAPARERTVKYNKLLEIEQAISK